MASVHNKLEQLRQWVDVDIMDSPVRNNIKDIINKDMEKDSPMILKEIDGKYSPFRNHLSKLGNARIDLLKMDNRLASTALVALAAIKFKNLGRRNRQSKVSQDNKMEVSPH